MAPFLLSGASLLCLLAAINQSFASDKYAAQRIPLGGALFQLKSRGLLPRQGTDDLGTDCGGDPDCTTTDWGCQCGFSDGSWITDTSTGSPTSSPLPTNVPGQNGVPGCAYVIYPDGQDCINANYCNCGGTPAPLLTSTVGGKVTTNCDYKTVPTSHCPKPTNTIATKPTKTPASSPKGTLKCNQAGGSYKKFSQSKAKDQITKLCQAYVDGGVVLSENGDSLPDDKYSSLEQITGASEDGSTLVMNPNWAKSACGDVNNPTSMDFKAAGAAKCEGYFMRAVDGCGEFTNPNNDKYWKWGGQNQEACVFWTVGAQ
ncbi:MAG: hypothetical protein LQ352_003900 [Teloschistes flavicans]|nr:MAG: hypothetical protein LQ352_003900 [Teloschistes flavicans]